MSRILKKGISIRLIFTFALLAIMCTGNQWARAQFIGWNFNGCQNGGPPTMTADSVDTHVIVGEFQRPATLTYAPAGPNSFWGAESFSMSSNSEVTAISLKNYVTFTVKPLTGCAMSLTSINPCYIYRSDAGAPIKGRWQYSSDGINFIDIGNADITWGSNVGAGTSNLQPSIDLSAIPALQNVTSNTTITFRIVVWGATSTGSDWGLGETPNGVKFGLQLNLSSTGPASPLLAQWDLYSNTNDYAAPTLSDTALPLSAITDITLGPSMSVNSLVQGYFLVDGFTTSPITFNNNGAYLQVRITVPKGHTMSISSLDMNVYSNLNFDASPGMKSQWAYILQGDTFVVPITPIEPQDTVIVSNVNMGNDNYVYPTVDCSGVKFLQNIPGGTVVSLRYFAQGISNSYFGMSYLNNTIFFSFLHKGITIRGNIVRGCSIDETVSPHDTTICQASSVHLSASGGTNFTWSPANGLSCSTCSNPVAMPSVSTTYTVTISKGGCTKTATAVVTVGNTVQAGIVTAVRDTICSGTTGTLSLTGNSSNKIQWQSSHTNSNFINNGIIDTTTFKTPPLFQTTYYRVIVGNGTCIDSSGVLGLYVPPALTALFTDSVMGLKQVTFDSRSSKGNIVNYYWDFGDGQTSTMANPVHAFAKDTTYYVCLTIYDGSNCSYTYCRNVNVVASGVSQVNSDQLWKIYPNPLTDRLFISSGVLNTVQSVEMYDMLGRTAFRQNVHNPKGPLEIDLSALPCGTYFLRVITKRNSYCEKVIKQ